MKFHTINMDGLNIFYREAGSREHEWHEYFRQYQQPTLVVWGKNDPFFGPEGAEAFQRDLKTVEVHLLDTGHFARDEECDAIADHILRFLPAHTVTQE